MFALIELKYERFELLISYNTRYNTKVALRHRYLCDDYLSSMRTKE